VHFSGDGVFDVRAGMWCVFLQRAFGQQPEQAFSLGFQCPDRRPGRFGPMYFLVEFGNSCSKLPIINASYIHALTKSKLGFGEGYAQGTSTPQRCPILEESNRLNQRRFGDTDYAAKAPAYCLR